MQEGCYNKAMRFLPDSAILGTFKKLKGRKGNSRSHALTATKVKSVILGQSWYCFDQDTRSFEELLTEARQHAKERKKAGK